MIARMIAGAALAACVTLTSCAGDPLEVSNCSELADAAGELLEAADVDADQLEAVIARADELAGDARARGADLEVQLCEAVAAAANAEAFERIAAELDNAGD